MLSVFSITCTIIAVLQCSICIFAAITMKSQQHVSSNAVTVVRLLFCIQELVLYIWKIALRDQAARSH